MRDKIIVAALTCCGQSYSRCNVVGLMKLSHYDASRGVNINCMVGGVECVRCVEEREMQKRK